MIRAIILVVFVFAVSVIVGRSYVMLHERTLVDNPANVSAFAHCLDNGWNHGKS